MKEHPLLDLHLRSLKLPTVLANYRRLAGDVAEPICYLEQLASLEVAKRHENGVRSRIAAAHFPVIKTIESFDFNLQPQLPKAKLLELFDCSFVEQHRNLICIGPPGTGKTHVLLAIGLAACTRGYRTLFVTAAELLMSLIAAKREERLDRKLRSYECYDLVLIDELGYIPFEREATDLLFQVISRRYERGSIALTTNLAFSDWTNIFPDPMAATAVIDRIVHHGTVFEFSGESQRLKSRQRRETVPQTTKTPKNGAK
ncbi:MAG: ATP-binding protein [Candidatus Eremiobacteraeota bacterium]|nr:ATP-binding protein [Candidatus Eremiobacteraeota bacterium]